MILKIASSRRGHFGSGNERYTSWTLGLRTIGSAGCWARRWAGIWPCSGLGFSLVLGYMPAKLDVLPLDCFGHRGVPVIGGVGSFLARSSAGIRCGFDDTQLDLDFGLSFRLWFHRVLTAWIWV